ncbi:MAG: 3-phosphoshikimate 1-carboxyvinyltransferase [Planctomycetota bacterium]
MNYPEQIEITPVDGPIQAAVKVPGSKSFSNRALPIAALANGESLLTGILDSEDTEVMRESLGRLGISVFHDPHQCIARVIGCRGIIPVSTADLFLANSGTSIRFLAALVALGHGDFRLDGIQRMRERPIGDLLSTLVALGVDAKAELGNDCPPVMIRSRGLAGGEVTVRGDVSSQFLSALLMVAPLANGPLVLRVTGELVSKPYVDMTLATMAAFGGECVRDGYSTFRFAGNGQYIGRDYAIEPDASAASYFFGAAAVTGGSITIHGLGTESLQGDLQFVHLLERMGCKVRMTANATTVVGNPLRGIDADLCHVSDTVPTLAAVACFADGPTTIRNVAHIRHKETDRISALVTEIRKTGIHVDEFADGLTIQPSSAHEATFDTYNDHRMAMSLSLLGLKVPGIVIRDPGCVRKTYPRFFEDLLHLTGG